MQSHRASVRFFFDQLAAFTLQGRSSASPSWASHRGHSGRWESSGDGHWQHSEGRGHDKYYERAAGEGWADISEVPDPHVCWRRQKKEDVEMEDGDRPKDKKKKDEEKEEGEEMKDDLGCGDGESTCVPPTSAVPLVTAFASDRSIRLRLA
jgi:hypothetical protein